MSKQDVLEAYKRDLETYSLKQLRSIPEEGVWSIGQMYDHMILVAHEYIDSLEACAASSEEQAFGKTEFGQQLFDRGGFPPIKIRLPDELNSPPNNTDSKETLLNRLEELIQRMNQWESKVEFINPNFKVKHDGFGWLNAREWFDLVGMHSRHHLRQKSELDQRL